MDQELIRKAAEAMKTEFVNDDRLIIDDQKKLVPNALEEMAAAALKVFYEHTRSQPREQAPLPCPDCGTQMVPSPVVASLGGLFCPSCGATRS